MKNFKSFGKKVTVVTTSVVAPNSPAASGDPCIVGRLPGVACEAGVTGGSTIISVEGVYNLAVNSVHNGLSIGETVFIDPSTGVLSDDFADVPFGTALGVVAAGATGTLIDIRLMGATPSATGANS
jgi:predicted RecA/RadA family phage recombinase